MEFFTKSKEEEEEEEEEEEIRTVACDFFQNPHSKNHQQWLEEVPNQQPLMDLSLRIDSNNNNNNNNGFAVEREHMFDKVVTPSDVGKLNRLVIPKQHAEKYFPLDSTTNDKGLILNFEDRNGKPWRFRYSYWNSSQSYVMTKGWSRFVKDKKLDAGDVVSFQRGLGDSAKDRLFIDWRRRPDAPRPHHHPLLLLPQSLRWASGRHFTLPPPPPPQPRRTHHHGNNYSNLYPNYTFEMPNFGMPTNNNSSMYYFRPSISSSSSSSLYRMGNGDEIVVNNEGSSMGINKAGSGGFSVAATAAKRLRLFGVNMECAAADGDGDGDGGGRGEEEDLSNGGVSRRGKEPLSFNWDLL